jgi:NlpC/P60 family putative phage cell wall peptidase
MSLAGCAEVRARVVAEAQAWLGTPYRHQASRKGVGCDCLGLVRGIWRALYGRELDAPIAYEPDWAESGAGDTVLEAARRHCLELAANEARPGDLLVFRWRPHVVAKHLGILIDGDRFIHAYQGSAVVASALVPQWRRRIAGVFAFPPIPTDL